MEVVTGFDRWLTVPDPLDSIRIRTKITEFTY